MTENPPGSPFPFDTSARDEWPDAPMEDDSSTPHTSSFSSLTGPLTVSSWLASIAMSRATSAPFRIGKPSSSSTSRQYSRNSTNPTELLKRQIVQAFKMLSSTIHQSQDQNLIALEALLYDASVQYGSLQIQQTSLAKDESIVDQELTDAKRGLAMLEGVTRVEREPLTAEVAGEF